MFCSSEMLSWLICTRQTTFKTNIWPGISTRQFWPEAVLLSSNRWAFALLETREDITSLVQRGGHTWNRGSPRSLTLLAMWAIHGTARDWITRLIDQRQRDIIFVCTYMITKLLTQQIQPHLQLFYRNEESSCCRCWVWSPALYICLCSSV